MALAGEWTSIGPYGGPAGSLSVDRRDPERLIASSRNGNLFVSENAGRSWTRIAFPRMPGSMIETVKIHPLDSKRWLVAVSDETGEFAGLYESNDSGAKWKRTLEGQSVFALAFFPGDPNLLAAGTRRGVSIRRDGVWSATATGPTPVMSLAFDPQDARRIYAGTTHLPWKTADGGKTWAAIHEGMLDDSDVFSIHVDTRNTERVYASACSGIYASDNAGDKWRKAQGIPGTDRRTHQIIADPEYSSLLLAGTTAGLWKSADAGSTWRKMNDYIIRSLEYSPRDSRVLYMATQDRGLMKSTTAGIDFGEINRGFVGRPVTEIAMANQLHAILVRTDGRTAVLAASSGDNWKEVDLGLPQVQQLVPLSDGWVARTDRGIFHKTGEAWVKLSSPSSIGTVYDVFGAGKSLMLRGTSGFWLQSAKSWTKIPAAPGRAFGAAIDRQGKILAATSEGLFRWADGWVRLTGGGLPDGYFFGVAAHGKSPGIWAVSQLGRVFVTRDDGVTWNEFSGAVEGALVRRLAFGEGKIYALAEGQGVFVGDFLP